MNRMRNIKHISILVAFLMQMVGWNAYSSGQVCMFDSIPEDYSSGYAVVRYQGKSRAVDRNRNMLPFSYKYLRYKGDGIFVGENVDTIQHGPYWMEDTVGWKEYKLWGNLVDSTGNLVVRGRYSSIWDMEGNGIYYLVAYPGYTCDSVFLYDVDNDTCLYLGPHDKISNFSSDSEYYMRCSFDKDLLLHGSAYEALREGDIYSSHIDSCFYYDRRGNRVLTLTDCRNIRWTSPVEDGYILVIGKKHYMLYHQFRLMKKIRRRRVEGRYFRRHSAIKYNFIDFREGVFILPIDVEDYKYKSIMINTKGECSTIEKSVLTFENGYACALGEDGWTIIDQKGNDMLHTSYADIFRCATVNDTLYFHAKKGGKEYVIRADGIVLPYCDMRSFSCGRAAVKINGRWGYVDQEWKEAIGCRFDKAKSFSEGYAAVKRDGKWGFIDLNGTEKIEFAYDDCHPFSEGMAAVKKDGKWFFIDKRGEVICFALPSEKLKEQGAK